jgi:hypothetical protein
MKKVIGITAILFVSLFPFAACGSRNDSSNTVATGRAIKSISLGNLTATLSNSTGQLKHGDQEIMLSFADSSGKSIDVGSVSLNFHMAQMGPMAEMNDAVTFKTTGTPGVYSGKVNIEVAGEWQGQLAYEGPAGKGKTTFTVTVQ